MASQKPWYEKERSCSTERPCSTRMPRARARFSSSSSRRVLPIPGSPATTTNWHSPATAAFRRFCSSANSLVRPTSGAWATRGACIDCVSPGHRPLALALPQPRAVALQRLRHLAGPLRPAPRVLLQAREDDRLQLLVDLRSRRPRRLRDLVDDAVEDRLRLAAEGRLPGHALVEHGPERVDVGATVDLVRRHLLRAQVGERPDERAGPRQPALGRGPREAEVHHPDPDPHSLLAGHHDVLRLDVPVHDAARVAVVERLRDLDPDVDDVAQARLLVAQEGPQVRPLHERHHEEERALVAAEVVDRDDGGVVHLRDHLRLALEAGSASGLSCGGGTHLTATSRFRSGSRAR